MASSNQVEKSIRAGGRLGLALASAALGLAFASAAQAQDYGFGTDQAATTVMNRPRPEYDALGVRVGGFMLRPSVTFDVSHDDNIYARQNNKVGDTLYSIAPSASLNSDWGTNALGFQVSGQENIYADHSKENNFQWTASANGRLDIQHDASVAGNAYYTQAVESRINSPYTFLTVKPVHYDVGGGGVTGTKVFNRLRVMGTASLADYDYEDGYTPAGVTVDQDFRDRTDTGITGRVDYAVSPATSLYVEASGYQSDYDQKTPGFNPNATGDRELVGARFDLTNLITGEVAVGRIGSHFKDPGSDDVSGFSYHANIAWQPTQLVTVTLTGDRVVNASDVVGSDGYISDSANLQADYELLRNVIISANYGYLSGDYRNIDRNDRQNGVGANLTYLMNRSMALRLSYRYVRQTSGGAQAGPHFTDNVYGVALVLQR